MVSSAAQVEIEAQAPMAKAADRPTAAPKAAKDGRTATKARETTMTVARWAIATIARSALSNSTATLTEP